MVQQERISDALRQGIDPGLGASVVELGLMREVLMEESEIRIRMVLTMAGCRRASLMVHNIQKAAETVAEGSPSDSRIYGRGVGSALAQELGPAA